MGRKSKRNLGQTTDVTFRWVTEIDPDLEQWRSLAEEWLGTIKRGKSDATKSIKQIST